MKLKESLSKLFSKSSRENNSPEHAQTTNSFPNRVYDNWFHDRYESAIVHRNMLIALNIACALIITFLCFGIFYIKSNRSIEPFVIEIEPKTGVPTVVDPITAKAYSGMDAVKRYFIWKYVTMREEFYSSTYQSNFDNLRYLSSSDVYWNYTKQFGRGNPDSPFNRLGSGTRTVELKSIQFPDDSTAQVRIRVYTNAANGTFTSDKIIYMRYQFVNLELNDQQRLVNPLGFQVITYKIDDERIS
jgi:type IV secretion system protein VirB8